MLTEERIDCAIQDLKLDCANYSFDNKCREKERCEKCHIPTALEALEKQIPKKPIDTDWLYCECGEPLVLKTLDDGTPWKFCAKCGQAIDWSDEE